MNNLQKLLDRIAKRAEMPFPTTIRIALVIGLFYLLVFFQLCSCQRKDTIWKSNNDTLYSGQPATEYIVEMPEEKYIDLLIEFEEYVYMYHIKYPDVVIAQAYLESGYLTSPLFVETNNPFGMRIAKQRPTSQLGEYNGYAIYSSLKDAVLDYAIWQNGLNKEYTKDLESYMNYLNSYYATDSTYKEKLWWIIKNQL